MLDTARHFLPVDTILTMLDGMVADKFNVMHWHISDAQSFPLEVHDSPARELGGGSYAAQSNGLSPTLQYNTSDVQTVVQFARNRGIRVIPEFDVPGHAYAWGLGNPNIVTDCPAYAHNINNIPLLASANETYQVIESLLRQVRPLFTDKVLHLGGDEVVLGCWGQDSRITRFMQEQGFQELSQVMQYFVTRVDEIATKLGWTVAHWQDVFDDEIATPMSAIMQVWRNKADVGPIIAWGNEVVVSNSDAWYLNCGMSLEQQVEHSPSRQHTAVTVTAERSTPPPAAQSFVCLYVMCITTMQALIPVASTSRGPMSTPTTRSLASLRHPPQARESWYSEARR